MKLSVSKERLLAFCTILVTPKWHPAAAFQTPKSHETLDGNVKETAEFHGDISLLAKHQQVPDHAVRA